MPYHSEITKKSWNDIEENEKKLILALINTIGYSWLSLFLFYILIFYILLSDGFNFPYTIIFEIIYTFSILSPAILAYRIKRKTSAKTPFIPAFISVILSLFGFISIYI